MSELSEDERSEMINDLMQARAYLTTPVTGFPTQARRIMMKLEMHLARVLFAKPKAE